MGWLNVGSLVLGLFALSLPVSAIIFARQVKLNVWLMSVLSLLACAIALYFQLYYQQYLIDIDDIPALLDTYKSVALISGILLTFTILLNGLNLTINRKSK
jgi:hypothetical protein